MNLSRSFQLFLGYLLLMACPVINIVLHNGYTLSFSELWILFVLILALAFLSSRLCSQKFGVSFTSAFLIFWFLSTQGRDMTIVKLLMLSGLCLVLFLFFLKIYFPLPKIILIFLIGLGFAQGMKWFLISSDKKGSSHTAMETSSQESWLFSGENVLYIILDEHIGVEGMPPEHPQTKALQEDIRDFYQKLGFTLFTKAYSPYFTTDNAIPNILNGTQKETMWFGEKGKRELFKNDLFDAALQAGYDLHVYQNDYIDYCGEGIATCEEYPKINPASLIKEGYSLKDRFIFLGNVVLQSNSVYRQLRRRTVLGRFFPALTGGLGVVPQVFGGIKKDILQKGSYQLFFVHMLMPHFPYVYDASCKPLPVQDWEMKNRYSEDAPSMNTPETYDKKYALYYGQIRCLMKLEEDLFESLQKEGALENLMVVIHGDHGSRINLGHDPYFEFFDKMTHDDFLSSYSTLLAIKKAGQIEGRVNSNQGSIIRILGDELYENQKFSGEEEPFVFMKQKRNKKLLKKVPMPLF
ncbi:MAG TPA: hypothetical protein DDW49_08620 [Deltaproteobacteria bacterium]|nr:MAG: hypothetical protein A2048_03360 [Deltaproteobacteria bacterium GWA2_45_12]HBF13428.1 hypothetical protein [Deltaproteobacteria bacterium]